METTLRVSGMDCAACAPRLTSKLERVDGVESVCVNYTAARCKINYDEKRVSLDALSLAVHRAGFELPLETAELEAAAFDEETAVNALGRVYGVKAVSCENGKISVTLWPVGIESGALVKALREAGIFASVKARRGGDDDIQVHERMTLLRVLCFSALFTMPLLWDLNPYIQLTLASIVQFGAGGRYFYRGALRALKNKAMSMDVLIAVSTTVIYVYSAVVTFTVHDGVRLYFLSECVLLSFILFGKYLETLSRGEAGKAIRRLMRLRPKTVSVLRGGEEREIDVDDVNEHDFIRVRPGERICVDGEILEGECTLDESMLTGESAPVDKKTGDRVYSGTLNRSGSFVMSASGIGKDSVLERIIKIVESAQYSKAPIERFADKLAGVFIPAVLAAAIGVFLLWFFVLSPGNWSKAVYCACALLVIVCPCALGLATPTAIMTASGRAAELGILFRGGEELETAGKANTVVLDKTGTLTYGEPELTDIIPINGDPDEALLFAASAERLSEHPIGCAVTRAVGGRFNLALPMSAEKFESLHGAGVCAVVEGRRVAVGSRELLSALNVDMSALDGVRDLREEAKTEVLVAVNGELRAVIGVADRLRSDARQTVERLKSMGLNVWMLTGDNEKTARSIAAQSGIENVLFNVRAEEKATVIKRLQAGGAKVCMVGDGINDAPALAVADVSIALNTGTDIAIETSGITVPAGELISVPRALELSKRTMHIVRQNLAWALLYNLATIPAAAAGIINPSMAAAAMSLSSNGVLLNSLRLRKAGGDEHADA